MGSYHSSLPDFLTPLSELPLLWLQFIHYFWRSTEKSNTTNNNTAPGPLIAFSYAGMLWSYYLGAVAFLRDHFDLHASRVALSGISAGCSSVMVIFLDLSIEQGFEFGLEWNKLFASRALRFMALSTSQTLNMIVRKFQEFGITDEVLCQQYEKYGTDSLHFGVTAFSARRLRLFHLLLNNFSSVKETVYAALCSMRIVPFFRSFGWFNGYFCCDGALTSNYSIPEIYRQPQNCDKVIKIGVLSHQIVSSDVAPERNFGLHEFIVCGDLKANLVALSGDIRTRHVAPERNFGLHEFIVCGDLKANLVRFERGYQDAAQFGNICRNYLQKGLVWSHAQIDPHQFEDEANAMQWQQHIEDRVQDW
eukprot:CAMPEP_0202732842 /NCGR_PEP_ID=MMETSP1385-20130828/187865_1 /ASSEMBLY_ACC=CAM_ASM_000861 /TAXON_ID=933848 /ORGANISM="Elphidium margaritaceum" /LENGTH=362 /DNA_ID=CAMNT_0049399165 /DNA_START=32 /DNA_END=1118 /DNA_ORIENTATION=-